MRDAPTETRRQQRCVSSAARLMAICLHQQTRNTTSERSLGQSQFLADDYFDSDGEVLSIVAPSFPSLTDVLSFLSAVFSFFSFGVRGLTGPEPKCGSFPCIPLFPFPVESSISTIMKNSQPLPLKYCLSSTPHFPLEIVTTSDMLIPFSSRVTALSCFRLLCFCAAFWVIVSDLFSTH